MYISENYLGFYSYLIGFELKILIELKNIKDIFKEPVKKLFRHSMRVTTKENQEVILWFGIKKGSNNSSSDIFFSMLVSFFKYV
jgi:hypothetical protein